MSTEAVKTKRKTAQTSIGKKIDQLFDLRRKKTELENSVKSLAGQISDLEDELLQQMEADGVEKSASKSGTVSISSTTVAQVEDWDAFHAYIYKNKFGHLLQRRVSDPAWRELMEQGKKVPGTVPFTKKKLSLRVASA